MSKLRNGQVLSTTTYAMESVPLTKSLESMESHTLPLLTLLAKSYLLDTQLQEKILYKTSMISLLEKQSLEKARLLLVVMKVKREKKDSRKMLKLMQLRVQ